MSLFSRETGALFQLVLLIPTKLILLLNKISILINLDSILGLGCPSINFLGKALLLLDSFSVLVREKLRYPLKLHFTCLTD